MEDLSLHILDLAENSIAAGARCVEITVCENRAQDLLSIEIADDGGGMNEDVLKTAADPFFTTRTTRRVGLGLSLFQQATKRAGGEFKIESHLGTGTKTTGVFQHSHLDRQPLGGITETLLTLVVGNPDIEFTYRHQTDGFETLFSTREVKAQLQDVPINSPKGISAVRKGLEKLGHVARSSA